MNAEIFSRSLQTQRLQRYLLSLIKSEHGNFKNLKGIEDEDNYLQSHTASFITKVSI